MSKNDCCFSVENDCFRYRVGAVIVSDGHVLLAYNDSAKHYYSIGGGVHIGERSEEAVLREVSEETGGNFKIERPLCLIENFFNGEYGSIDGLNCHTIELYYLMKLEGRKEYDNHSITMDNALEKMRWLPIDKIDEYDIRPAIIKDIIRNMPESFCHFVNDDSREAGLKKK